MGGSTIFPLETLKENERKQLIHLDCQNVNSLWLGNHMSTASITSGFL